MREANEFGVEERPEAEVPLPEKGEGDRPVVGVVCKRGLAEAEQPQQLPFEAG